MTRDFNLQMFNDPAVVAYYDRQNCLHESERHLFEMYLKEGMAILDLGVGAGRTTPYLSGIAARYVGLDYSDAMIAKCRSKFPTLSFVGGDASDMSVFPDGSFEAVVFSFNGIDYLPNDEARAKCLEECARVLRPGGVFILSSHNARYLFFAPLLNGARPLKKLWRLIYAVVQTVRNSPPRITSKAFWRGVGYLRDPLSGGGLITRVSTQERLTAELRRSRFTVARIVGAHYPQVRPTVAEPWYYYACVKDDPRDAPLG